MTRPPSYSQGAFAVTVAVELDRVCTEFDRALRGGKNPRIEDFLGGFQEQARERVLANLLVLDMEHRVGLGEIPGLHDYQSRFPNDLQLVKSVYIQAVMPTHIGRFEIERVLGKGGFGRVYLAYDRDLKRHVAIKSLLGYQRSRNASVPTLLQEAQLAARLKHAAIVPVYEVGQDEDGDHFVVLEYIEGTTFKRMLHEGSLPLSETLDILVAVAEALQYAHERGLTHRDLKPANILIDRQQRPYITDFGLAVDESMQLLRAGEIAGTPPYMAPEQAAGETHRVDGRTDIWAFGVILYEVLTGSLPFTGDNREELFYAIRHMDPRPPRQRDGSIPVRLERITLTCLAKRMAERYSSAADLVADLRLVQRELAPGNGQPANGSVAGNAVLVHDNLSQSGSRVVPKGLRSFDVQDASFFLRLLPEPRDSNGLPESIRFWQAKLNETDEDATFSIGLIYGPSGCGKSSFVKAGLLPRLADHVVPIVVESTRDETEVRLLKAVRKLFPDVPNALALPEIIAGIRETRWGNPDRKVVIVLDQFEQWLHANPVQEGTQLADALRQCDGGHVQVIMLVRDDFWMQLTRLLRVLEVPLIEGSNSAAVDLFDVRHAENVLGEFGVAYGKLPEQAGDWTETQRQFIAQAVNSLAVDGRVVPVRLALFVEMVKGKPWTTRMLKEIGGAEGTGVAFLDESFASTTAAPEHRLHQAAARAVLECLLPPEGTDIRGNMRSERELLEVSGYSRSKVEFDRLVGILDTELRLITPTDPSGQASQDDPSPSIQKSDRHYQLTHDYLVPAIRVWLSRSKRNTARGRAELRLAERAAAYRTQPHNRQLPNILEWLSILLLARNRTSDERTMMRAATRRYTSRIGIALAAGILLVLAIYDGIAATRADGLVQALTTCDSRDLPKTVATLPSNRWRVQDRLLEYLDSNAPSGDQRVRIQLGLVATGAPTSDELVEQMLLVDPALSLAISKVFMQHDRLDALEARLSKIAGDAKSTPARRLRAGMSLAQLEPERSQVRWDAIASTLSGEMLDDAANNPTHFSTWADGFWPVRQQFVGPLRRVFQDTGVPETQRLLAANMLARYVAGDVPQLLELAFESTPKQFSVFASGLSQHASEIRSRIVEVVQTSIPRGASETEKDKLARRQANAIVLLYRAGDDQYLWPALEHRDDPRLRSFLLDYFRSTAVPADWEQRLEIETDAGRRQAMILAIGYSTRTTRSSEAATSIARLLLQVYREDVDPGVHSAAEWALQQIGKEQDIDRAKDELAKLGVRHGFRWYVTPSRLTMIIVEAPGEVRLGSPESEPGRDARDEALWTCNVHWRFAVSATEITQQQYRELVPEYEAKEYLNEFAPSSTCPVNAVSWLEALRFCRVLSERDGIPESEMAIAPVQQTAKVVLPEYLERSGYRLPTEAEWEIACRAGTTTPRFFGYSPDLLPSYCCYISNSGGESWRVGRAWPNGIGLFDTLGNVAEWCLDVYAPAPQQRDSAPSFRRITYAIRGNDYASTARMLRSANRRFAAPADTVYSRGFRIAHTVHPSPTP